MDSVREEVSVKKKSKKRKNEEAGVSGGDDGSVQVCNERHKKKMKVSSSVYIDASEVVNVSSKLNAAASPEKKKKKKDRGGRDGTSQENGSGKERKKGESFDEVHSSSFFEATDKISRGSADRGFSDLQTKRKDNVRVEADKDIDGKKVKSKEENALTEGDEEITGVSELAKEGEEQVKEAQVKKTKKKKKKKKSKEFKRTEADCATQHDTIGHGVSVDSQIDNEVIDKVELVKDKQKKNKEDKIKPMEGKKKKKGKQEDDLAAGSLDGEMSNKRQVHGEDGGVRGSKRKKEKSVISNTKGDANIDGKASEENGAAGHADSAGSKIVDEVLEKVEAVEEKKRKKKKKDDLGAGPVDKELWNSAHEPSSGSGKDKGGGGTNKSKKYARSNIQEDVNADVTTNTNEVTVLSERSAPNKKQKKVRFSDHDEFFTLPDDSSKENTKLEGGGEEDKALGDGDGTKLVRGKRFTKEENEIVKKAVLDYIEERQLGDNGLEMVLRCQAYPEVRDCWKEIRKALPYRPQEAIYHRAHVLFERDEKRKWTPEDFEQVKKFHEKYGPDWKTLANEMGKFRHHVKDAWRRIRLPNARIGDWSQEEYQKLFDLVNLDLSMKVHQEKKSKHGMLRDNICWEAISEKLGTRTFAFCCDKWYYQLRSPMAAEGTWCDADDYRLLIALVDVDAACEEDVDWDNLLEHRSGDVCGKRWNQMVCRIGEHRIKSFNEQVDILSQRYCPEILEVREEIDSKPTVD